MKFVRLSEFKPKRTPEMIAALELYQLPYQLIQERRAAFEQNGRTVTASIKFLDIKIAELIKEAADPKNQKLLEQDLLQEISYLKRKFADNPEEMTAAIKNWLQKSGVLEHIWVHLYHDVLPKASAAFAKGYRGGNPIEPKYIDDLINDGLKSYMDLDGDKSIIRTLMQFDASKGNLMTWIDGGFMTEVQRLANFAQKSQNQESSMNVTMGDEKTEVGDLMSQPTSDKYDIGGYMDKANELAVPYRRMTKFLQRRISVSDIIAKALDDAYQVTDQDGPDNLILRGDNDMVKEQKKAVLDKKIDTFISNWSSSIHKRLQEIENPSEQKNSRIAAKQMFQEILEKSKNLPIMSVRDFYRENLASTGKTKAAFKGRMSVIENDETGFKQNLDEMLRIGPELDEVGSALTEIADKKNKLVQIVSQPGLNPDIVQQISNQIKQLTEREEELTRINDAGAQKFQELTTNIQKIDFKFDESGRLIKDVDKPQAGDGVQLPVEIPVEPEAVGPEDTGMFGRKKKEKKVTTPRLPAGKELISPDDRAMLMQQMEETRNRLRPAFFRALSFPKTNKGGLPTSGTFGHTLFNQHIDNLDDYDVLTKGQYENASPKAKVADIIARGLLYTRDMAALDNSFVTEVTEDIGNGQTVTVGGGSKPSRDVKRFWDFVHKELEAYNDPEVFQQGVATLQTLIKNLQSNKGSGDVANFRELYEKADYFARAAAYEEARGRLFGDKGWDELTDEDRRALAEDVFKSQYGLISRSMYVAKPSKQEPRYPLHPDVAGDRYINVIMRELWRLGYNSARNKGDVGRFSEEERATYYGANSNPKESKWFEIVEDENAFRNRGKPTLKKQHNPNTTMMPAAPVETGDGLSDVTDETIAKIMMNTIVRIAESLDKIGEYRTADTIMRELNTIYG